MYLQSPTLADYPRPTQTKTPFAKKIQRKKACKIQKSLQIKICCKIMDASQSIAYSLNGECMQTFKLKWTKVTVASAIA